MKKILIIAFVALIGKNQVNAQANDSGSDFKKSTATVGAGYSLFGLVSNLIASAVDDQNYLNVKTTVTPVIIANYDYYLDKKFSLGAAYTYQSLSVKYTSYKKDTITYTGDFKDVLARQNFGVRPLFHFTNDEKMDAYLGARLSYTRWSYKTDSGKDYASDKIFAGRASVQALIGARYYFHENVGLNMEFAIGNSYFAMFGVNARF